MGESSTRRQGEFAGVGIASDGGSRGYAQLRSRFLTGLPPAREEERASTRPVASELLGDRRAFVLRRLAAGSDLVALLVAGVLAVAANAIVGREPLPGADLIIFAVLVPTWLAIASLMGLYHLSDRRLDHTMVDEVGPVLLVATVWSWTLLLARIAFSPSPGVEVLPSLVIWASSVVTVLAGRSVMRLIGQRRPWFKQRVAVIGSRPDMARVLRRIARHPEYGLELVRTLEIEGRRLVRVRSGGSVVDGGDGSGEPQGALQDIYCNFVVGPRELSMLATQDGIDRVVIASGNGDMEERGDLVRSLVRSDVHVDIVPGNPDAFSPRTEVHYVEGMQVLTIPAVDAARGRGWTAIKRGFDLALASGGILLLSPVLLYFAIRIKRDSPGPVLFRQERIGYKGRRFELLKFRTMIAGAEDQKDDVATLNLHASTDTSGMFKVRDDPRVTRFGAGLRRWSLDELPQLFNVFRGDMSLVGPRPLIPEEACLVTGHYVERLQMRPGITGLWQTLGRSNIGFDDMVKLDYAYVAHWSFGEDVRLLLRTVEAVALGRGAY